MQQHVEGDWMVAVAVAEALEAMIVRRGAHHGELIWWAAPRRRGTRGEPRQFISTIPFAATLGLAHLFPRITFPSRVFFFPFYLPILFMFLLLSFVVPSFLSVYFPF
jgi:hypothetical protein